MMYVRFTHCSSNKIQTPPISSSIDHFPPQTQPQDQDKPPLTPIKVGLNSWDTADIYSPDLSEKRIAKALVKYESPRSRIMILSECYLGVSDDGSQPGIAVSSTNDGASVKRVGLSRKHIFDLVDKSCERLGM